MFFRRILKMITNITIENFRQFDHLEVKDLKRINFFVGKNNCGKTTVLEALFWSLSPLKIESINSIYAFRKIPLTKDILSTLFLNQQESNSIKISICTIENKNSTLEIEQSKELTNEIKFSQPEQQLTVEKSYGYKVNYKDSNDERLYEGRLVSTNQRVGLQINIGQNLSIKSLMMSGAYISDSIGNELMRMQLDTIKSTGNQQLSEYLQLFDPNIQGVEFGLNNSIRVQTNNNTLPLELMGDGFIKYLRIVLGLVSSSLNILFIDEIENGLHFETQKKLLRIILTLSKEKNLQMFITTHSYETLKFLSEIMQEDEFNTQQDEVQVINVANTVKKGYQSYNYSIDGLIDFIHNETEVRD